MIGLISFKRCFLELGMSWVSLDGEEEDFTHFSSPKKSVSQKEVVTLLGKITSF